MPGTELDHSRSSINISYPTNSETINHPPKQGPCQYDTSHEENPKHYHSPGLEFHHMQDPWFYNATVIPLDDTDDL